jgi:hypothetical protein
VIIQMETAVAVMSEASNKTSKMKKPDSKHPDLEVLSVKKQRNPNKVPHPHVSHARLKMVLWTKTK